jgi:hypothetical protein
MRDSSQRGTNLQLHFGPRKNDGIAELSRPSFDERAFDVAINSALTLALRMNPPFVIPDKSAPRRFQYGIEKAYVQSRAAALWLLSKPSDRWLVPEELRAFLEDPGHAPVAEVVDIPALAQVGDTPPAAAKHGGGAPNKYEWETVRMILEEGCRHCGAVPHRKCPDLD